ncbi:MAG: phosphatase PAP2 family protein [Bacillota bacterium]
MLLAIQTAAVQELDQRTVIAASGLRTHALTAFMKTVTFFGTKYFLFPATAIVTVILFWQKSRYRLVFPLAMLVAWFVMDGLKLLIARPRPDFCPLIPETGYSFPSGHAFMGALFFGFLAGLLIDRLPSRPGGRPAGKWAIFVLACLFVALLGFTRIYLGVHYPTDTLAGYAGGLFFLGLLGIGKDAKRK